MEGCKHSGRYLVWRPRGLDDVPLVLTKVVELRVKIGESRRIGALTMLRFAARSRQMPRSHRRTA
jgi:hypothetical protein